MEKVKIPAYGKINLFLDIKNVREDGFHNLEMVMQSIKLHDNITLVPSKKGINIITDSKEIPTDESNLASQAAKAVMQKTKIQKGVNIHIDKNIPVAAGLAGGSADAAAVIKGMNQLFELDMDYKAMHELAAGLGSDVPFCIKGGTAFATGRGEILNWLSPLKKKWVILIKPPQKVSTKEVYQLYDKKNVDLEIPVQRLIKIIKDKDSLDIKDGWANVLEPVTKTIIDEIEVIEEKLIDQGFNFTIMTGSGTTVFSLIDKDQVDEAKEVVKNWDRPQDYVVLTETINEINSGPS